MIYCFEYNKFKNSATLLSFFISVVIVLGGCNGKDQKSQDEIPRLNFQYQRTYPHDTLSFTEGLLFHKGKLYESTAANHEYPGTRSLLGEVDLSTGKIVTKAEIDGDKYFGEGIVFLGGKIFQLTYKNKIGFIYDESTFKNVGQFPLISKEGWGMTTDGTDLIMSDGTNRLTYLNPDNQKVKRVLPVSENNVGVSNLNELEFIDGFIYANIWLTNTVVKIHPKTGEILGKFDFSVFSSDAKNRYPRALEMNGIAYDSSKNELLITGKLWPKIYTVKF